MRRRRIIWVLAWAGVVAGVAAFWPRAPKEPVYQGRRLSEWIREIDPSIAPEADKAARQALRAIGTNALPWLLDQFDRRDSRLRIALNALFDDRPAGKRRHPTQADREQFVRAALHHLGPHALPALPALNARLRDARRGAAPALAMSACGTNAIPFFLRALASTNPAIVRAAVTGLGNLGPGEELAVPPLLQALGHTNARVRWTAVFHLGRIYASPDLVTPALARAMADTDEIVRLEAADGLKRLSVLAGPALPELLRLTTNSNPSTAAAASNVVFLLKARAASPAIP